MKRKVELVDLIEMLDEETILVSDLLYFCEVARQVYLQT